MVSEARARHQPAGWGHLQCHHSRRAPAAVVSDGQKLGDVSDGVARGAIPEIQGRRSERL
jgi:hypothetical protein